MADPSPDWDDELETTESRWWGSVSGKAEAIPTRIVEPFPTSVAAVVEYVSEADIDIVVADASPDRGLVPPLAADASQALTRDLQCPLFVVGQTSNPNAIQRLLVPTDLSENALRGYRHAVGLARLYDAEIDVLHVIESLPYLALTPADRLSLGSTTLSERRGRRQLHTFLEDGGAADVRVRPHIIYGDPADQISEFVDRSHVNLMVFAAQSSGKGDESSMGRVGEHVLGRATCPTFLLPTSDASLLAPPGNAS